MRATDGTFASELASVFQHVYEADLEKTQTWDYVQTITGYCAASVGLTKEDFEQAILKVFKKEDINNMLETIPPGMLRDGFVQGWTQGKAEGEAKGKVLAILEVRFNKIPKGIEKSIRSMVDLVALQSLAVVLQVLRRNDSLRQSLTLSKEKKVLKWQKQFKEEYSQKV